MADREVKLKPGSLAWDKAALELALSYAPPIGVCRACKQPCVGGYCCPSCGSGDGCYDYETGESLR